MKKIIFGLLMLMGITGVQAQEYEYVPLVREGVKRVYLYDKGWHGMPNGGPFVYYTDEMRGDTTINGIPFKKLYRYFTGELDVSTTYPYAYIREVDKKVYAVLNEQVDLDDYNLYKNGEPKIESENFETFGEYLIYDFNDFVAFYDANSRIKVVSTGLESVGDAMRKAYYLDEPKRYLILEGEGAVTSGGLLFPNTGSWVNGPHPHTLGLSHVIEGDEVVYKSPRYDELKDKLTPTALIDLKTNETPQGDNRYYNLMGQPVAEPTQPGIYIHQGKKLVVK